MQPFARVVVVLIGLATVIIQCTRVQNRTGTSRQESCGFRLSSSGERISWKNRIPIQMYIDSSVPDEFVPLFHEALQTWNQAFGKKLFSPPIRTHLKSLDMVAVRGDRRSTLIWRSHTPWHGDKKEQAQTVAAHLDEEYLEADIYINAVSYENPNGFKFHSTDEPRAAGQVDARSIFLHEAGHVLGLVHRNDQNSVMAEFLHYSDVTLQNLEFKMRRTPKEIDLQSLECEYK